MILDAKADMRKKFMANKSSDADLAQLCLRTVISAESLL